MYGYDDGEVLFTRKKAAEYLSVSPNTLAVWASTGRYQLNFIKVGRKVRYRRSDLNKFLLQRLTY